MNGANQRAAVIASVPEVEAMAAQASRMPPERHPAAKASGRVLISEPYPVQYRAPVYRELARLKPEVFEVLYASDLPVRGHQDAGFGVRVQWNTPLLEGYPHRVLGLKRGDGLAGFRSLGGEGVYGLLRAVRPTAVLMTSFAYVFDWVALLSCRRLGIPVWIRQETQDVAFRRCRGKAFLRSIAYRVLYLQVAHAFYIGELNRQHLRRHGIPKAQLSRKRS